MASYNSLTLLLDAVFGCDEHFISGQGAEWRHLLQEHSGKPFLFFPKELQFSALPMREGPAFEGDVVKAERREKDIETRI